MTSGSFLIAKGAVNFARPRAWRPANIAVDGVWEGCMRRQARSTAWAVSLFACLAATSSQAADLIWEVESPFRFFKASRSFALHEAAFNAARGDTSAPLPADIVWRTERALNDPDCKDASTPDRCAATAGKRYQQSRLGWAAQTLDETCYESNGRPRRYAGVCERKYSWGTAKEDYVLPVAARPQAWGMAPGDGQGQVRGFLIRCTKCGTYNST